MAISFGTGSFADPDYGGLLYPPGLSPDLRLSAYAMWLDHLEVNAAYYSTPRRNAVQQWVERTPARFTFDVRLHRVLSQSPDKAARAGRILPYFLESMEPLFEANRLGTFLLVLAPIFAPERHVLGELDAVIERLRPHPLAIELRHRAWVQGAQRAATLAYFRERGVAWVAVDMPPVADSELMPAVDEVTQPRLAYLRLHGRNLRWKQVKTAAERHTYSYSDADLDEIVLRIRRLAAAARSVRVVANNHAKDYAPRTALALKERLGGFG
jgi:uncharacterized protein YecE (DUF72 family)